MNPIYNSMKKLINKKFYPTAAGAQDKLDTFYAVSRIDDDQYTELTLLVAEKYPAED